MAHRHALASLLLAASVTAAAPDGASAQCRLCSTPSTQAADDDDAESIRLQVETSLDFDRLVLLGTGEGMATILPNGERSASGTVATVSARAMVGAVTVHGEAGRSVRVEMPSRIDLYSVNGASISIEEIESDLATMPRLDSAGNLSFRFGGRLKVTGDAEGEYRGDVPITVDYL
jgi:hypothetical protein